MDTHSANIIILVGKKPYLSLEKACGLQTIEGLPHSLRDQEKHKTIVTFQSYTQRKTKKVLPLSEPSQKTK